MNPSLAKMPWLKLYGSRPPVGTPESSEVRTCESCIANLEYFTGDDITAKGSSICSMNGSLLFVVFEIGQIDNSAIMDGDGKIKIKWIKPADAKIEYVDSQGEKKKITGPFGLTVEGLTKTQLWSIGDGEYDRKVTLEGDYCFLPPNNVYSFGDYQKFLNDANGQGSRWVVTPSGDALYPVVTEIYAGSLKALEFTSTAIPVFHPVTDPEVINAGQDWTPKDWLKTAIDVINSERLEVGAQALDYSKPYDGQTALPAAEAAPVAAIAEAKPIPTPKPAADPAPVANAWADAKTSAFSSKAKKAG
jgi:hypothetical protein